MKNNPNIEPKDIELKRIELKHTDHYEWYAEDENGWRLPIEMLNEKFIITVTPK